VRVPKNSSLIVPVKFFWFFKSTLGENCVKYCKTPTKNYLPRL
jgi:hypothetical protein